MIFSRNKKAFGSIFTNSIIQPILIIWAIFQIYPLIWLFYSSLKPSVDISQKIFNLPTSLYFENYNFSAFNERGITLGLYFKNSVIVTFVTLIILVLVSMLAAYSIAKIRFPGKNALLIILIGMLGIPIHALIVPLYYFIAKMGLLNNYFGLILPYVAFNAPFSIILLQTYFRQFPDELIEAAKIDGCNNISAFFRVVMPVSLGAISSVLIINFISIWNEFLFSLVIMKNNSAKTINVGLMAFRGQYQTEWGPLLAALVVVVIPTIIFYFIFHRNILKGIASGAIKG